MGKKTDAIPVTERRNLRTRGLDRLPTRDLLSLISREDARVVPAVAREIPNIARAVDAIAAALASGGRLVYVGAGTSGRLAALDAAECPPTFGVSPNLVQAVIAGGTAAMARAIEAAEDSATRGARDLKKKEITPRDVVVGLSASGTTPYVLGALRLAKRRKATTIAVTCNPRSPLARRADIVIALQVGAEVIAGSTRMKAGTAQKLVLNMLSTGTMVRLGHVYDNWMINVALANRKLRGRALRILQQATGATVAQATRALRQAARARRPGREQRQRLGRSRSVAQSEISDLRFQRDALRVALIMLKRNVGAAEARQRLRAAGGDLRTALGESGPRHRPVP